MRYVYRHFYVTHKCERHEQADSAVTNKQNENHYKPMLPNDYLSYEFRLPRLTLESTEKYRLQTQERNRQADGLGHHWRAPLNSIPSSLSLPRSCYQDSVTDSHIYRVVGYEPPSTIVIDDDDDRPKPPSSKRVKFDTTASQPETAQQPKPEPAPAPKTSVLKPRPPTPAPEPKPTTPVKYTTR